MGPETIYDEQKIIFLGSSTSGDADDLLCDKSSKIMIYRKNIIVSNLNFNLNTTGELKLHKRINSLRS